MTARLVGARFQVLEHSLHAQIPTSADPNAPAILLIHGVGISSRFFARSAPLLAEHCRVYALDMPGFGRSSKPATAPSIQELADVVAAWMATVGLWRVTIWANSFGCQVAINLAVHHPNLVAGLVLDAPTIDPAIRSWVKLTWHALGVILTVPLSLMAIALADYLRGGIRRFLDTLRGALHDPVEAKLPRVAVPALVVRGSRDTVVSRQWGQMAARLLPEGRFVEIPEGTHASAFTHPEQMVRLVLDFVKARSETE